MQLCYALHRRATKVRLICIDSTAHSLLVYTKLVIFGDVQSCQRNTLHPCAHELHIGCTTGELALSDELHPSLKP